LVILWPTKFCTKADAAGPFVAVQSKGGVLSRLPWAFSCRLSWTGRFSLSSCKTCKDGTLQSAQRGSAQQLAFKAKLSYRAPLQWLPLRSGTVMVVLLAASSLGLGTVALLGWVVEIKFDILLTCSHMWGLEDTLAWGMCPTTTGAGRPIGKRGVEARWPAAGGGPLAFSTAKLHPSQRYMYFVESMVTGAFSHILPVFCVCSCSTRASWSRTPCTVVLVLVASDVATNGATVSLPCFAQIAWVHPTCTDLHCK